LGNVRSVLFFLLGDSPASEFSVLTFRNSLKRTMKMEESECSEKSAHKIQTPENHPKERIEHSEQDESLKSIV